MNFFNINKKIIKQCLLLCVTAYLTFNALFIEKIDEGVSFSLTGGAISSSRSLQDEEKVPDTTTTDIVVIITGKKKSFHMWIDRLNSISPSAHVGSVSLLFGSTDEMIPQDACEKNNEYDLPCQVAFIPDTTWTEGRNLLAGEVIRKEVRRNKKYDYWLFLDDDVEADCSEGGWAMVETLGKGSCWENIFNFISSDQVPENASTIALPLREGQRGFAGFSTTDSMFAAFKRDRVPYLLPYTMLREDSSQWTSQAAMFCIMRTCMKSSAVFVPYVSGSSPLFREYSYVRGRELNQIRETIEENFHDEKAGFYPCMDYKPSHAKPYAHGTGTFKTADELNANIPPPDLELCEPMRARFDRWKHEQLASSRLD